MFQIIKVFLSDYWCIVVFEEPIELERNISPIDHFQFLSELLLLFDGDELFGLFCFRFDHCAAGRPSFCLVLVD